jgi:thioredoxin reductase (NADPH)
MTQPAMLVLDDEPAALDELRGTLDRRYGREYLVVCEGSTTAVLDRLARLAADDRPVAIVCVPAAMLDTGGAEFLAMAHRLNPTAKRVLIVPRGGPSAPSLRVPVLLLQDQSVAQPVLRAMTLGVVDTYLASPHGGCDEGFHLAVSELLEEWARDSAADQPAVRIIGQQHSPRAHELRDVLPATESLSSSPP